MIKLKNIAELKNAIKNRIVMLRISIILLIENDVKYTSKNLKYTSKNSRKK